MRITINLILLIMNCFQTTTVSTITTMTNHQRSKKLFYKILLLWERIAYIEQISVSLLTILLLCIISFSICGTNRRKLTKPTFPAFFFRCIIGLSFSQPELKARLNLGLKPTRVVGEFIFTKQWIILLVLISA